MYAAKLTFHYNKKKSSDWLLDELDALTSALRHTGQILDFEPMLVDDSDRVMAYVRVPRRDSLSIENCSDYVSKRFEKLVEGGVELPTIEILGTELSNRHATDCMCSDRPSLILLACIYTESPIRCGGCFGDVPGYEIPPTWKDKYYDDLRFWEHDYGRCYGLFMGCETGERFGYREISKHDSSLGKRGREVCARIESLTGVPTYYYLIRHQGRPGKAERDRSCPSCGSHWRLDEPWHRSIIFRCDACRLVSEDTKST